MLESGGNYIGLEEEQSEGTSQLKMRNEVDWPIPSAFCSSIRGSIYSHFYSHLSVQTHLSKQSVLRSELISHSHTLRRYVFAYVYEYTGEHENLSKIMVLANTHLDLSA
jgi:hypothetical protein